MRIAIGSDHRGFPAKQEISAFLRSSGHEVDDLGTHSTESVDYPDFAEKVGRAVASGQAQRGILICGSGIGMSITANKVGGIRAALCRDERSAAMSRSHNDANVLCMGADFTHLDQMKSMAQLWLATPFDGGRHERRIRRISEIEMRLKAGVR